MIHWTEKELREMAAADAAIDHEGATYAARNIDYSKDLRQEQARLRKNERARERYKNDPVYRKKQRENYKRWAAANPERARAASRASSKRYRDARRG